MPFYILNDYKKEDGWELVYNFCSDNIANQEGGKNFLIFYNILTGKLRVFYYNDNIITGGNATVAAFRTESPTGLFDYCNSYIDNVTDIPKYKEAVRTNITTFESKATNLGWNCFDISVAYDPNNYPDYMNIGFYDQNIETINLSGLINLSSSGTVTSTNVSNPVSWLVDLVGEEGGKKVEEIWNTSIRKKDAECHFLI